MSVQGTRARLPQSSVAERIQLWLLRAVAVYCLFYGLFYWIRIIGILDDGTWRFDLMPLHWQAASVSLAVLFPFASIGLWMLASWGPVVWVLCAATEIVMFAGFPDLFGYRWPTVFGHLAVALCYAGTRLIIYNQKRKAA